MDNRTITLIAWTSGDAQVVDLFAVRGELTPDAAVAAYREHYIEEAFGEEFDPWDRRTMDEELDAGTFTVRYQLLD